jgi:hypothetical protein
MKNKGLNALVRSDVFSLLRFAYDLALFYSHLISCRDRYFRRLRLDNLLSLLTLLERIHCRQLFGQYLHDGHDDNNGAASATVLKTTVVA